MLTCRLEAAMSYTLPVDTIFTIARYRIYHFLQSRAAGLSWGALILCVHSRLVKSSACEVHVVHEIVMRRHPVTFDLSSES